MTTSSMFSSKSCSRCIRAKLCNSAVATLMTRVFAKAVSSPKCRHGKRRLSNVKHLNNTPSTLVCSVLVHLSSTLWLEDSCHQICSTSVSPVSHKNAIKSTVPAYDLGDDRRTSGWVVPILAVSFQRANAVLDLVEAQLICYSQPDMSKKNAGSKTLTCTWCSSISPTLLTLLVATDFGSFYSRLAVH